MSDFSLINLTTSRTLKKFCYCLTIAAKEHIVQMLLNIGTDDKAQGEDYRTALQAASAGGHKEIVQMLLNKGADVEAEGGDYGTVLQVQGKKNGTGLQAASVRGHQKTT